MKLIILSILFMYIQCCPLEEAGNNPTGLFAIWPKIKEKAIAFFYHFNQDDQRSEAILKQAPPDSIELADDTPRIIKRYDFTPRPSGWLWCSNNEENATFAFKLCPGDPYLEECLTVTNVSRKQVLDLMEGSWWNDEAAVKKWALCYLSRNGVMSPAGVLRQEAVLRYIPDEDKANVEKTINKCLYQTAHDPVDTAWNYLTCFRTNLPAYAKIANRI